MNVIIKKRFIYLVYSFEEIWDENIRNEARTIKSNCLVNNISNHITGNRNNTNNQNNDVDNS